MLSESYYNKMSGEGVRKSSAGSTSLSAKWQLDAALLSRPVDLTTLVSMSRLESAHLNGIPEILPIDREQVSLLLHTYS